MKKTIKAITCADAILFIIFVVIYRATSGSLALALAITCGTIFYHFAMRLIVGSVFDALMNNKADINLKWFQTSDRERKLYSLLKVKKWKKHVPTYEADVFDPSKKSWDEITQAMCQAELVHETIVVLSFAPILFSARFGAAAVFVITSLLAAAIDLVFVVVQRYNRARVIKLINRKGR